ncbi:hypothetical protein IMCC9480_3693 [Oxalobacteraceae bacterium IMCC9480]|nr:hypothetical protein IMCC9480_3693 [Oxalobacteraceae bacterium IMCC9480]
MGQRRDDDCTDLKWDYALRSVMRRKPARAHAMKILSALSRRANRTC